MIAIFRVKVKGLYVIAIFRVMVKGLYVIAIFRVKVKGLYVIAIFRVKVKGLDVSLDLLIPLLPNKGWLRWGVMQSDKPCFLVLCSNARLNAIYCFSLF